MGGQSAWARVGLLYALIEGNRGLMGKLRMDDGGLERVDDGEFHE